MPITFQSDKCLFEIYFKWLLSQQCFVKNGNDKVQMNEGPDLANIENFHSVSVNCRKAERLVFINGCLQTQASKIIFCQTY